MARAPTTSDVFNAIAEPRRRRIIEVLSRAPRGRAERSNLPKGAPPGWSVNDLVEELHMPQPAVSKHLGVLRKTGIVAAEKHRRQRIYRLEGKELKPVFDWTKMFEQFWTQHLDRIKERAERRAMIVPQSANLPNPMFHLPVNNSTSNHNERN
jgi:DNA-binding transcriptional ArsR family regulator